MRLRKILLDIKTPYRLYIYLLPQKDICLWVEHQYAVEGRPRFFFSKVSMANRLRDIKLHYNCPKVTVYTFL